MNAIDEYCDSYLDKIFYFSLKRTGDEQAAEELASDISYEIISSLKRGAAPDCLGAWVWKVAANVWGRFAKRRWYSDGFADVDLDDFAELLTDDSDFTKELVLQEELTLMRRTLAHIRSDYRQILVAHYIEEKRVSEIARVCSLPVGTVKTKLINSRKALKAGMDMAREFGTRSYNPEEVYFSNSCSAFGENGQPWRILDHKLYKNIFLEAYGNPSTAEKLSMELGVAMPYMEEELEFLVRETFLTKEGKYYQTAFPIISADAQKSIAHKIEEVKPEIARKIAALIDKLLDACERHDIDVCGTQSREEAKWTLAMSAYDRLSAKAAFGKRHEYTVRPDSGRWDIVGYQQTELSCYDFVGLHGCLSTEAGLPDINFGQYKFYSRSGMNRTPDYIEHRDAYTLHELAAGRTEGLEQDRLERLVEYGYVRKTGDSYLSQVLVFKDRDELLSSLDENERAELSDIADNICGLIRGVNRSIREITRNDMPPYLRKNDYLCEFACGNSGIDRRFVCAELIASGWLRFDESMTRAVGAYVYI